MNPLVPAMSLHLLKNERVIDPTVVEMLRDDEDRFGRIRCPHCQWRPLLGSRWSCLCINTPEPPFRACGMLWNTFSTRGRCPGCSHQWRWTSCLHCQRWSLHDDWYERL